MFLLSLLPVSVPSSPLISLSPLQACDVSVFSATDQLSTSEYPVTNRYYDQSLYWPKKKRKGRIYNELFQRDRRSSGVFEHCQQLLDVKREAKTLRNPQGVITAKSGHASRVLLLAVTHG